MIEKKEETVASKKQKVMAAEVDAAADDTVDPPVTSETKANPDLS